MTDNKIPERCQFTLTKMEKNGHLRTVKLNLLTEFAEIICKQNIRMIFDYTPIMNQLNQAKNKLILAEAEDKKRLITGEKIGNNAVAEAEEEIENIERQKVSLEAQHKDFIFEAMVREHKNVKPQETVIVLGVNKTVIDWFDKFALSLGNYVMLIKPQEDILANKRK